MYSRWRWMLVIGFIIVALTACAPGVAPTPVPPFEPPEDELIRQALIDNVEVVLDDPFIPTYLVEIEGHFRDTCEQLWQIQQTIEDDRIMIEVLTSRPEDAICAQVLVSFEHSLPLQTAELEPGMYIVDVNGVQAEFELLEPGVDVPAEQPLALVDSVEVLYRDDDPSLPYAVRVEGNFRDGCEELDMIVQELVGNELFISIITTRPEDAICTQALVPFTHTIPLDVEDLAPGEYTVYVNGVAAEFVLGDDVLDEGVLVGPDAIVDSVEVLPGAPPIRPVALAISGYYPDGCTSLARIEQEIVDDRIVVTVYTSRPVDAMCTQALVPFRHRVILDVQGLDPGTYTVEANGVEAEVDLSPEDVLVRLPARRLLEEDGVAVGRAPVEGFEIMVMESYPVQLSVTFWGTFRDGCARLDEVVQVIDGQTIHLQVYMQRDLDAICTMALVPFEETVRLDIAMLPPDTYTIHVNGLTEELVLDEGMVLPEPEHECPVAAQGQRLFVNARDGYCFVYPDAYSAGGLDPRTVLVTAAQRSDLPEPRVASLTIERPAWLEGLTLDEAVQEQWATANDWEDAEIGGLPATVVAVDPGEGELRQALLVAEGEVYLLTLTIFDADSADQMAEAEELWTAVVDSFLFY